MRWMLDRERQRQPNDTENNDKIIKRRHIQRRIGSWVGPELSLQSHLNTFVCSNSTSGGWRAFHSAYHRITALNPCRVFLLESILNRFKLFQVFFSVVYGNFWHSEESRRWFSGHGKKHEARTDLLRTPVVVAYFRGRERQSERDT